jgi:predicted transcriptional regulator of viral defense system
MNWQTFYSDMKDRMVVESRFLYLTYGNKNQVELQLSRWARQNKIHRLKKGYYVLNKDYRRTGIYEPYIAAILKSPSYISLEKGLEMHHLIPDVVYTFTSVTTKRRPVEFINTAGRFKYVAMKKEYFWGYRPISPRNNPGCTGYLAEPEKALIDLFYYHQKEVDEAFIESLRLQNTEELDKDKLAAYARKMGIPFISRAVELVLKTIDG